MPDTDDRLTPLQAEVLRKKTSSIIKLPINYSDQLGPTQFSFVAWDADEPKSPVKSISINLHTPIQTCVILIHMFKFYMGNRFWKLPVIGRVVHFFVIRYYAFKLCRLVNKY